MTPPWKQQTREEQDGDIEGQQNDDRLANLPTCVGLWFGPSRQWKGFAKALKSKKDKHTDFWDNIPMYYLGIGWEETWINWLERYKQKTILQLAKQLTEVLKFFKNSPVRDNLNTVLLERKYQPIVKAPINKVNIWTVRDTQVSSIQPCKQRRSEVAVLFGRSDNRSGVSTIRTWEAGQQLHWSWREDWIQHLWYIV